MISLKLIVTILLIGLSYPSYIPQLMLLSSTEFFNAQITKLGPLITSLIQNYTIPDQHINQKVDGVHVTANLSKINLKLQINWKANVLNSQNRYNFTINSKNINMTINAHIQFKVGLTAAQKGQLIVMAQKVQADTYLRFQQPKSSTSIGFDIQISKLYINSQTIQIKIQGKRLDNYIIKAVTNLFKNRIPTIIDNAIQTKVNPKISQLTSTAIIEPISVKGYNYIVTLNTSQVPHFVGQQLAFPIDLTLTNEITNSSNDEIENQNLPQDHIFDKEANVTVTLSSNMLNSILWLVNDAKLFHFDVFPEDLGQNPPIALNTLNLSILMPQINKKWPKKNVSLRIEPAAKLNHLYIRNGRVVTALSLSVNFIVNLTDISSNITYCLQTGDCVSAITLNISLPISASVKMTQMNFLQGIIHGVQIYQLKKIDGLINVKEDSLKQILNTIVGSSIPAVNFALGIGKNIDISKIQKLKKYNITGIFQATRKDYLGVGALIQIQ